MLSFQHSTTVSLETYPLYWFIWAYFLTAFFLCLLFVFIMLLTKCNNITTKILLVPWLGHNHPEPQVAALIEAGWERNFFIWIFSASYIVSKISWMFTALQVSGECLLSVSQGFLGYLLEFWPPLLSPWVITMHVRDWQEHHRRQNTPSTVESE